MKLKKRLLLGTALILGFGPAAIVSAQGWQARTVDQVAADIQVDAQNKVSYTVQYGDTLGVISKALGVDLIYLAEINHIDNINLIFPGTVLVAQYDHYHKVDQLAVQSPAGEKVDVDVPVDLAADSASHQNVVDFTTSKEEATDQAELVSSVQPAQEFVQSTTESLEAEPAAEATEVAAEDTEVSESVAEVTEAPVVEVTEAPEVTTAVKEPVVEVTEAPVVEATEAPEVSTETTESLAEEQTEAPEKEEASVVDDSTAASTNRVVYEPVDFEEEAEVESQESESTQAPQVAAGAVLPEENEEEATTASEVVTSSTTESVQVVERPANGLQSHVANYRDQIASQYGVSNFSGYRPGDPGDHGKGLAIDFMVPVSSELGDRIASQAIADMKSGNQNINYVIWKQRISGSWTGYDWKPQEDRGGITANHYDHVHVSFN